SHSPVSMVLGRREGRVGTSGDDHTLSAFVSARPRLFGIAYRMLGSAVAIDLSQRGPGRDRIPRDDHHPIGHQRRPVYPLAPRDVRRAVAPGTRGHQHRSTPGSGTGRSLAVLVLMEKLSPTERAAYVLRERVRLSVSADRGRSPAL